MQDFLRIAIGNHNINFWLAEIFAKEKHCCGWKSKELICKGKAMLR